MSDELASQKNSSCLHLDAFKDYQEFFMNAPLGIFTSTPDGRFLSANPAMARMCGYDSPERLISSVTDIGSQLYHDPGEREKILEVLSSHGELVNYECRLVRQDGSMFWASINVRAVGGDDGRITRFNGFISDVTDQRRAEESLMKSQERFALAMEVTRDGIWDWDLQTDQVYYSPGYAGMLGYASDEIEPHFSTWLRLVHPEDRDASLQANKACIENRQSEFQVRFRMQARNGEWRWILGRGKAVERDESGRATRLVGTHTDITDQMRIEEALRKSESLFRKVFEILPVGLWIADKNGKLVQGNPAGTKIWGASPKVGPDQYVIFKAVKLPSGEEVTPENWALAHTVKHRKTITDELLEIEAFDNEKRVILNSTVPVLTEDGELEGAIIINQDITASYMAEQALRESEERFSKAFMSSPAPQIISEIRTGRVIDVNDRWVEMLEYSREEQIGRTSKEVGIWADPADRDRIIRNLDHQDFLKEEPIEFRTKSGKSIYALWSAEAITLGGKRVMLSMIYDETQRKMAEQEKENLRNQLFQSQKIESMGILAGGVAHDFNNLLQAMGGNIQFLMMGKFRDHPDLVRLKAVQRSIDRAAQLVRHLLVFSRKAEPKREIMDLNNEIRESVKVLQRTIPRMIRIDLDLADDLWLINADPVQIEQVMFNLGLNAADAMPEGGQLLIETRNQVLDARFVQAHFKVQPGRYVQINVTDTGSGMDKHTLEHIFDPFFTTKEVGKGTGLGLASVYGIVKGHKGYVFCYSEPGRGTSFKIYLPAETQAKEVRVDADEPGPVQGGKETILVVDDEKDIRSLTAEALLGSGYRVITAEGGEEALQIYSDRKQNIDLVILDLNMPGMGGHQCLEQILSLDPKARVLVASGYSAAGQGSGILESGAAGYIGKPYQFRRILEKIREILDAGSQ
ncbi:hybrid sensor histidine kinase/response regulator [Desulfonatronovibrio hydrogenovorans]|uniref:hybrid sensor histidine kinase/response regulator n=1 Tax=Desulfonatronovibrio hydrogenovorans TaxID=53245 RepID=UPI000AFA9D07|nr:PAS domain S-box protein [Desulfonatronovibrio hydrogenovorans]